jgi:D-alanyl-D-alanine carboxypeptidase (penicillin-binding protein 5/6)
MRLQPVLMNNHNHLLGRIPGVDGLKTGFTSGAGFCLSATALRNGRRIIVVMMDSPDSRTRDLNVQELITEAFIKLPVSGAAFKQEGPGGSPAAPQGQPSAPTRPSAPAPGTTDSGPVIHIPGEKGS